MFHLKPLCRLRVLRIDGRRISLLRHRLLRITLIVVDNDLHRLRLRIALISACRNELATLFLLFTRLRSALAQGGVEVVFVQVINFHLRNDPLPKIPRPGQLLDGIFVLLLDLQP